MNGQDPPCPWQGYPKVDGSGQCTVFIVSDFQLLDYSTDIILVILLTSLLEREFQRLLSLVLKLSWLKSSQAGSELEKEYRDFETLAKALNYLNSNENKHLISSYIA